MDGPYREPKPLKDVIAPDRRRHRAAVLIVASMAAGALVFQSARWLLESSDRKTTYADPVRPALTAPTRMKRVTLRGPDGAVVLPTGSRVIVNVWLEGCQDCMPAFEAMRSIAESGGLGLRARVINVAYGEADPSWAARYGVRDNLVYDDAGALIVKPLGISTFTTLVVDGNGDILLRDRPDRPGYADRIRRVMNGDSPTPFVGGELTSDEVQVVVRAHQTAIRDACWQRLAGTSERPATVKVTASIVVGANGDVVSASASNVDTDALVASCVETQIRTWKFPAHGERSKTVQIPFVFARQ